MNEAAGGAESPTRNSQARPALLGVACGAGAALFWALGFVATRHGLKAGFTPPDLLMHRFLWSGIAFLPLVLRAGIGNLCGIGWGRGLVLMVLGGPVMSLISYTGFLFVPLGHGSVIQPSSATLGGLLLAAVFLRERVPPSRVLGAVAFLIAALVWWALPGADSSARADETEAAGRLETVMAHLDANLAPDVRESIAYAFRELLLNAVEWGGKLDPTRKVRISCLRARRMLLYRIADPGEGFDIERLAHSAINNPADNPLQHAFVREEQGLRPGGLGLAITRSLVDELIYNEARNEVVFVKYLD